MKYIELYKDKLNCNTSSEVFEYLISTLKESIKGWNYFVDWAKVLSKVRNIEITLNLMNYLIGKEDVEREFKRLLEQHPEVLAVIPILIACRNKEFTVLDTSANDGEMFKYKRYRFQRKRCLTREDIDRVAEFASKSGILDIFKNKQIKNIVDYVVGIEVGLDSNARKNRSGTSMELLAEIFIKKICDNNGYKYLKQATAKKIRDELGYNVKVDKTNRTFDFAIDNKTKLYLIETNYYSGGGSKLKATAGEYKSLFDFIKSNHQDHGFIWITEGKGWITAKNSLEETFHYIDHLLNLDMLEKGILEHIITCGH